MKKNTSSSPMHLYKSIALNRSTLSKKSNDTPTHVSIFKQAFNDVTDIPSKEHKTNFDQKRFNQRKLKHIFFESDSESDTEETTINAFKTGDLVTDTYGRKYQLTNEVLGTGTNKTIYRVNILEESHSAIYFKINNIRNQYQKGIHKIAGVLNVLTTKDDPFNSIIILKECMPFHDLFSTISDTLNKYECILLAVELFKKISIRLIKLHSLGYAHLDIKPENLGYDVYEDNCVLLDSLNLKKVKYLHKNRVRFFDHTLHFASPEVKNTDQWSQITNKSDIYSWGKSFQMIIPLLHETDDLAIKFDIQAIIRRSTQDKIRKRSYFDTKKISLNFLLDRIKKNLEKKINKEDYAELKYRIKHTLELGVEDDRNRFPILYENESI